MNLSVIYYSTYGANAQLAQWAKEAGEALGANVRVRQVAELAPQAVIDSQPAWKANQERTKDVPVATSEDIEWADAILFSVPSRFGNVPSQFKQFIDTQGGLWAQGKTINKAVTAVTSAQNPHGGQEATLLNLYTSMHHWGAIVVSPGYTDASVGKAGGNPYGTSVTIDANGNMVEDVKDALTHQVTRLLDIAQRLKK
ncbi:MAG: NAD(P)H-dependent oxidoreductase [Erysipelotrichaceae bacterium]|nr:NAD(P)H-dependent oxidoreductase [Erysipelotrichaceae bacterium]MCD8574968.1 NAD(P)H-dependent oxidoreductase [Erysipelotrichaceae bacterium]